MIRFELSSHVARRIVSAAIFATLAASSSATAAVTTYTVTDLGTLPGGAFSSALGINTLGQVAGASDATDAFGTGQRGFLFSGGQMINLGLPPVPSVLSSTAPALNDGGAVVVNGYNGAFHAFLWHNGEFTNLTTLPGAVYSEGQAINNDGHVVGNVVIDAGGGSFPHHAFLYNGRQMIDLNANFGGDYSDAAAINDSETVVGEARFAGSSIIHGFILHNGVVTSIIAGATPDITTEADAISNNGLVAGGAYFDGVHEHPMMYVNGNVVDLGLLAGAIAGSSSAINNAGTVVGECVMTGGVHRAFVYAGGAMSSLTNLVPAGSGWIVEQAADINDAGQIAATARGAEGYRHAVLLTPIVTCAADINGDSMVNVDDLLGVITHWGNAGGAGDVNGDGIVNVNDVLAVITAWGPCP